MDDTNKENKGYTKQLKIECSWSFTILPRFQTFR